MQNIFIISSTRHLMRTRLFNPVKNSYNYSQSGTRVGWGVQNVTANLNVDKCRTKSDLIHAHLSGNVPASGPGNYTRFTLKVRWMLKMDSVSGKINAWGHSRHCKMSSGFYLPCFGFAATILNVKLFYLMLILETKGTLYINSPCEIIYQDCALKSSLKNKLKLGS